MRLLYPFFFFALFISLPIQAAQTNLERLLGEEPPPPLEEMDSTALSHLYFKRCVSKDDPVISNFSQEMLCGCTAAHMHKEMNTEELRAMFTDTKEGGFQRSRVMRFMYVPCMESPLYDLVYYNCRNSEDIRRTLRHVEDVCTCMAENISTYFTTEGARIVSRGTRSAIPDPDALMNATVSEFVNSNNYAFKARYYTATCIQKHEYGW